MPIPTAQQAAANWARGMTGASDKAKAGVMALQQSPTEAAAQAVPRAVQGVIDAAASGKTAASLRAVSLQSWQNSYITKGLPIMGSRASQAQPKVAAFMNQFLPFLQSNVDQLKSMPRGDLNQNIQRAVTMMELNSKFKYNKQATA